MKKISCNIVRLYDGIINIYPCDISLFCQIWAQPIPIDLVCGTRWFLLRLDTQFFRDKSFICNYIITYLISHCNVSFRYITIKCEHMFTVCEVDLLYIYDIIYHMLNKKNTPMRIIWKIYTIYHQIQLKINLKIFCLNYFLKDFTIFFKSRTMPFLFILLAVLYLKKYYIISILLYLL